MRFLSSLTLVLVLLVVASITPALAAPMSVTVRVSSVSDNCRVYYNGSAWSLSTTDVASVGYWTASYNRMGSGFRFTGVNVPPGATITSAYIVFTAFNQTTAPSTGIVVNATIQGEASIQPASFSTYADFIARPRTVQTVYWNSIQPWTPNAVYQSPDVSSVVQMLINQQGWQSGGSMVLFWGDTSGTSTATTNTARHAYSYSFNPALAPYLVINYDYGSYTPSTASIDDLHKDIDRLAVSISDLNKQNTYVAGQADKAAMAASASQTLVQTMQTTMAGMQATTTNMASEVKALAIQSKAISDIQASTVSNTAGIKTATELLSKKLDETASSSNSKLADVNAQLQSKIGWLQIWIVILLGIQLLSLFLVLVLLGRRPISAQTDTVLPTMPAVSVVPAPIAKSTKASTKSTKSVGSPEKE